MEVTNYYCDRCKREVRTYKLFELTLLLYGIFNPKPIYSDLCKECSKEFEIWYKLKRQPNEKGGKIK